MIGWPWRDTVRMGHCITVWCRWLLASSDGLLLQRCGGTAVGAVRARCPSASRPSVRPFVFHAPLTTCYMLLAMQTMLDVTREKQRVVRIDARDNIQAVYHLMWLRK
jgi:hypothetical protein